MKVELWTNRLGDLIQTRKNMCGCHLHSYLVDQLNRFWDRPKILSNYYEFNSRREFRRMVNSKLWEKVDEWTE